MVLPAFEEKHEAYTVAGYPVTNEEPETIRRMLRGKKFAKAGAIAGGGEISVFTLLPFCEELYCVDHSHRALVALYTKLALLQKLGITKMRRLLDDAKETTFYTEALKVVEDLPEGLRAKAKWPTDIKKYDYYTAWTIGSTDYGSMRREWGIISDATFRRALSKLDRVKILHGDLVKDLRPYGKFDLLYISNAHEHINRDSSTPRLSAIGELVADKGFILASGSMYKDTIKDANFKVVSKIKGPRSSWYFHLLQKIKPRKPRKAKAVEVPSV